jgi:hypothetical protein
MLELDAALNLRSGGGSIGVVAVVEPADPARERGIAGSMAEGELAMLSCMFHAIRGGTIRTLDALESWRAVTGRDTFSASSGTWLNASARMSARGGLLGQTIPARFVLGDSNSP